MRELSDDDALWIGQGVPLMDSRNAEIIALVRAGYRAAQAAMPPREPTPEMCTTACSAVPELRDNLWMDQARDIWRAMHDAWTNEQTSGGTRQRPEEANASKPESRTGPPDHQSAAGTNCAAECAVRAPESFARGPAADPIADLCERLRAKYARHGEIEDRDAADALERLAATERLLQACTRHETARAERAEAERDALRECVRAADNLRRGEDCPMCDSGKLRNPAKLHWDTCAFANYDAARAKVNTTEGEK